MLGYLPGLIHAWYIIARHPERDYDYEVIADDTNNTPEDIDNYTLNVLCRIQPAKGMEYINQVMALDPTGVTYS